MILFYNCFLLCCRSKRRHEPSEFILDNLSSTDSLDKTFENEYANYSLAAPVLHNTDRKEDPKYSLATAPVEDESSERHSQAIPVFDDPIYSQPHKTRRLSSSAKKGGSLRHHKQLKHTASTENLLEDEVEDSGEYEEVKKPQLPPRPVRPVFREQHDEDR